ncbi:BMP family lipoprotein [Amedibacillus sp. YH-ame6]
MNKFSKFALVAALATTTLAGCGSSGDSKKDDSTCSIRIGFVTDTGGVDDKSFNQGSWEGIKKYAKDNNLDESCIKYLQSKSESDYEPNLSQLAEDKFDLVVAAGYLFDNAMTKVADNYPDTKFFVIDTVVAKDNVESGVFAAEQGSYLAGMAAALQAKSQGSDNVGFIGGMESELIQAFQAGFEQGAKAVDPNMKVTIDYAGAFDKPDTGQTLAEKQYAAGVSVIYHAAGGTGGGVIKAGIARAEKGEKVWVIGVDRDQYTDGVYGKDKKSVILTSALKKVDTATYNAAQSVVDKTYKGGSTVTFDIKNDGVGIPAENPNLSKEILTQLETAIKEMKDGKIEVSKTPSIPTGSTK